MATTTNLELLTMTEDQNNRATAVNTTVVQLERALTSKLDIDTTLATVPDYTFTIPFDDANDLSSREALRNFYFVLSSAATANFNLVHPDNRHMFYVTNNSNYTATVKTASGLGVAVSRKTTRLLYCDGVDVIDVPVAGFGVQYFNIDVDGVLNTNNEVLLTAPLPHDTVFDRNFGSSGGFSDTPPASQGTFDVDIDGVRIGGFTANTDGTLTFTTDSPTAFLATAGQILTIHNTTAQALTGLHLTMYGKTRL